MEILTTLAGLNFRPASAKEAVDNLELGATLRLQRDPENEYDSNAVQVLVETDDADQGDVHCEFIGFIPKVDNTEVAEHLDSDGEYTCTVVSWLGTRKPGLKVVLISDDNGEASDLPSEVDFD